MKEEYNLQDTQKITVNTQILDQALHSLNTLAVSTHIIKRVNMQMQQIIVSIIKCKEADQSSTLKEIGALSVIVQEEHRRFIEKRPHFQYVVFGKDDSYMCSRFYQRVLDRVNRKILLFNRYRNHLDFLKCSLEDIVKLRDCLNFPENYRSLEVFNQMMHLILVENQKLYKMLLQLIVSKNYVSSVDQFNAFRPEREINSLKTADRNTSEKTNEKHKNDSTVFTLDLLDRIRQSYTTNQEFFSTIRYDHFRGGNILTDQKTKKQLKGKIKGKKSTKNSILLSRHEGRHTLTKKQLLDEAVKKQNEKQHRQSTFNMSAYGMKLHKGRLQLDRTSSFKSKDKTILPLPLVQQNLEIAKEQNLKHHTQLSNQTHEDECHTLRDSIRISHLPSIYMPDQLHTKNLHLASTNRQNEENKKNGLPTLSYFKTKIKQKKHENDFQEVHTNRKTAELEPEKCLLGCGLGSLIVTRKYNINKENKAESIEKSISKGEKIGSSFEDLKTQYKNIYIGHSLLKLSYKDFESKESGSEARMPKQIANYIRLYEEAKPTFFSVKPSQHRSSDLNVLATLLNKPAKEIKETKVMARPKAKPPTESTTKVQIYSTRQYKIIA